VLAGESMHPGEGPAALHLLIRRCLCHKNGLSKLLMNPVQRHLRQAELQLVVHLVAEFRVRRRHLPLDDLHEPDVLLDEERLDTRVDDVKIRVAMLMRGVALELDNVGTA
jgi:hypothetical protein